MIVGAEAKPGNLRLTLRLSQALEIRKDEAERMLELERADRSPSREVGRIAQRLTGVAAFGDRGKIENGERDHRMTMLTADRASGHREPGNPPSGSPSSVP